MEFITRRGNGISGIRSCRWALFAFFLVVLLEVSNVQSVEQVNAAGSQTTEDDTTLDEEMPTSTQYDPAAKLLRQLNQDYADVKKPTVSETDGAAEVKATTSADVTGLPELEILAHDMVALSPEGSDRHEMELKTNRLIEHLEANPVAAKRAVATVKSQLPAFKKSMEADGESGDSKGASKRSMFWGTLLFGALQVFTFMRRRVLSEAESDCYYLSDPSLKASDNPSSTSHQFCDDDLFCVLAESQDAIATCKLAAADLDLQTATLAQTVEQCQRMVYSLGLCQLPTSAAAFLSL